MLRYLPYSAQNSYLSSKVWGIFSLENDGIFTYEVNITLSSLFYYSLVLLTVSTLLSVLPDVLAPKKLNVAKQQAYECGFDPFFLGESVIEIHFIIVALLFVIFDLEIVFLMPYVTSVGSDGPLSVLVLFTYLLIVSLVFVYEWFMGGLSWPVWFTYQNE